MRVLRAGCWVLGSWPRASAKSVDAKTRKRKEKQRTNGGTKPLMHRRPSFRQRKRPGIAQPGLPPFSIPIQGFFAPLRLCVEYFDSGVDAMDSLFCELLRALAHFYNLLDKPRHVLMRLK